MNSKMAFPFMEISKSISPPFDLSSVHDPNRNTSAWGSKLLTVLTIAFLSEFFSLTNNNLVLRSFFVKDVFSR